MLSPHLISHPPLKPSSPQRKTNKSTSRQHTAPTSPQSSSTAWLDHSLLLWNLPRLPSSQANQTGPNPLLLILSCRFGADLPIASRGAAHFECARGGMRASAVCVAVGCEGAHFWFGVLRFVWLLGPGDWVVLG